MSKKEERKEAAEAAAAAAEEAARQEAEEVTPQENKYATENKPEKEGKPEKEAKGEKEGRSESERVMSAEAVKMAEDIKKIAELAEDYKRKWYSVSAEYDNYRKRMQTAISQAYQDGKAEAILKLLPVADTFIYAYDGADENTRAGIDKILKNFNNILHSLGVEAIAVNVGDLFDEAYMEAIMNVPCDEGEAPNTVKTVLKNGYKREGKIIRFAQVCVTV